MAGNSEFARLQFLRAHIKQLARGDRRLRGFGAGDSLDCGEEGCPETEQEQHKRKAKAACSASSFVSGV